MKALSLVEPFASLIVFGHKTIELRKWNTNFRGEFLVHASRADPDPFVCKKFENFSLDDNSIYGGVTGAILGKATIYGVKRYRFPGELRDDSDKHRAGLDYFGDSDYFRESGKGRAYGFLVSDPVHFQTPIPCKGALNFWEVPEEVMRLVK